MDKAEAPQERIAAPGPVTQVIGDRYMDFHQLKRYLEQTFGPDNFTLQVCFALRRLGFGLVDPPISDHVKDQIGEMDHCCS
jgi:hypothetical protein